MKKSDLTEQAIELRRTYYREWRAKNKDKVRLNNQRYWERKVLKAMQDRKGENE